MLAKIAFALCLAIAFQLPTLQADPITVTLPEFSGISDTVGPFPHVPVLVGTFSFAPPATIFAATISGFFGNSAFPNSSGVDLFVDGVLVTSCPEWPTILAPCNNASSPTPWVFSFGISDFPLLADGVLNLTAVQTSQITVRLGESTLTVNPVPEPRTFLLLLSTLIAGVGCHMRRQSSVQRPDASRS